MYDGTLKFDTSIDQSGFQLGLSSLGNIAKQGMAVIGSFVAGATAGIAALGTASVQTGMQFDAAMSQVGATLGYSVDQIHNTASEAYRNMNMLTAKAEEMGAATSFSATQAANGLNILAQSGYSAAESVQMIDSVLKVAAAGGMSLDAAASYIAGSMKGFTKEAGNFADNAEASTYYADMIAKGATLANTSVSALGEALSDAAASADAYGQGARTTEVALLRLAEQGETGSAAATALAAAMKNLYAPTDQAKAALEALGVDSFDKVTKEARDFNTVVDELASALNQYDGQTRTELETVIFGEQGKNAFDMMVASSTEKVQNFYDSLDYTEEGAKGSAALQAETMLDNLAGDITVFQSATEGFQIAISKNLDAPLREIVQKATEYMSDLTDILKARGLDGLAEALGDRIADALDFISGYIPGLAATGSKLILSLANGLTKNIPAAGRTFVETGKTLISGLMKNLPDMTVTGMEVLHTLITGIADNLPELISTGEQLLTDFAESMQKKDLRFRRLGKSILKSVTNSISQNLPELTGAALHLIDFLVNLIPGNLSKFTGAAVLILLALADGLIQSIPILIEKVPEIIRNLEQAMKDNADLIKDSAHTILEKLGESLKNAKDKLKKKAPKIMQNVVDALKNAPLAMGSVADSIITAIADALGVKDKWKSIKKKVSDVIGNIDFEAIKLNLEIAFEDIPDDVRRNFENVTQTFSEAVDRMKNSFNNLKEKFQPLLDTLKEYFDSGKAGEDASDALGTSITVVAGAIATAADAVSRMLSGIMDFAAWLADGSSEAEAFSAAVIGIATTVGVFSGILKIMEIAPGVIAGVQAAIAGLSGAASGLWGVIAANPLIGLLALLAGAIAMLVYVSQTSEEWQLGWEMIKEAFQNFADAWNTGFKEIKDKWEDFWNSWEIGEKTLEQFGESVYDFVEGAKQWGKDLIDNFIGGVKEKWNDWEHTWEGVGEVIYDLLHHTHPDKGLLKDDNTWMPDMMQSFSEGIRQHIPMVTAQAENLTDNLHSILNDPVSVDVDFPEPEVFTLPEIENPELMIDIPDIPELDNPKIMIEVSELPEIDTPEADIEIPEMPSIDVPELSFSTPELPDFHPPALSPEAWEAFRFQSMRTPAVSAPDAGSEIINNHYSYSTVNNTQNQQNFQQNQPYGDIIIPVSIGGQQLETMVISAIQIENARSGGWTL